MTAPDGPLPPRAHVLTLCTGNAARSVMAGFMLEQLAEAGGVGLSVVTAGTHVVDGQPMSIRTRTALESVPGLGPVAASRHRSHQVLPADLARADLVVAMEADHVRYIRRRHPEAASRTATIRRLCRDLPEPPPGLARRVAALDLAAVTLERTEDVKDPAGGEQEEYTACARELFELCCEFVSRL